MKYPFEAEYQEILNDPDSFVTAVFSSLASEFLVLPKGEGFIDYPQFEAGYEALKKMLLATRGKVFTLKTLAKLVECSNLRSFKTKP